MKSLSDEPQLGPHLRWVWKAFTDLNYRRGTGFSGPLPLSYTDIEAYCRLKGIYSLGDRERLLSLLDPLDRHWMADAYKDADKKTPPKNKPADPSKVDARNR